jgi:hypothetical protein
MVFFYRSQYTRPKSRSRFVARSSGPTVDAWNRSDKSGACTLSNNDKTVSNTGSSNIRSTQLRPMGSTGKYYFEFHHTTAGGSSGRVGIMDATQSLVNTTYAHYVAENGSISIQGVSGTFNIAAAAAGDITCVAVDTLGKYIWFRRNNGPWNGYATGNPSTSQDAITIGASASVNFALYHVGISSGGAVTLRTKNSELTYKDSSVAGFTSWMGEALTIPSVADAWNVNDKSTDIALSNSDRTVTLAVATDSGVRSTQKQVHGGPGKYYAELKLDTLSGNINFGIKQDSASLTTTASAAYTATTIGNCFVAGASRGSVTAGSFTTGDVISMAFDGNAMLIWFRDGAGNWNNNASADPATGVGGYDVSTIANGNYCVWFYSNVSGNTHTVRLRSAQLTVGNYPSGFLSWMGEALPVAGVTGTGVLTAGVAALAGAGLSQSISTSAVLTAPVATIVAPGISSSSGTSALVSSLATLAASGTSGVGGGLWTPAELGTDLIAWYDFADSATVIQSGGFLIQWNDKSGNARHGVASSSNTLSVNSDGVYIANATSAANLVIQMPPLPSAYFDLAFAGKPNPFGSYRTLLANKAGSYHHVLLETGTNNLGTYSGGGGFFQPGTLTWPSVDSQIYYSGASSTTIKIGRDGNSLIDETGETFTPDVDPALLNYGTAGGQGFGTAREFVFMTASRSQDTQDKVSGYLAWKWDGFLGITTHVTALPAGHPYKSAAPQLPGGIATGTGTLPSQSAVVAGTGVGSSTGTATLPGQIAAVAGFGTVSSVGTSALAAVALQRTNLLKYSQAFNSWTAIESTVTADAIAAPDGTVTAESVTDNANNAAHYLLQGGIPYSTTAQYTFSVYAKAGTLSWLMLYPRFPGYFANFNLATGTLGQKDAGVTSAIEALPNGWYRCSITAADYGAASDSYFMLIDSDRATPAYAGTGKNLYLWGAQSELGPVATAHIPTGAASVSVGTTIVGVGIARHVATGTLPAQAATLAGAGTVIAAPSTGTGTLAAQNAAVVGPGVARHVATGALASQAATVAGAGIASSAATGALNAGVATLAGVGDVSLPIRTGTGTLAATSSASGGVGSVIWVATGTLAPSSSVVAATGLAQHVATGILLAQAATATGAGSVVAAPSTGTGTLTSQSAAVVAPGISVSVGTGTLTVATAATVAGAGISQVAATGALAASPAITVAPGISSSRSTSATLVSQSNFLQLGNGVSSSSGTGALIPVPSFVNGQGTGAWRATGTLPATVATLSGVGVVTINATGALVTTSASLTGAGVVRHVATGTMPSQSATAAGAGVSSSTGTGALTAGVADVDGFAVAGLGGAGAFFAQSSTIVAVGVSQSSGLAALTSSAATVAAPGVTESRGVATLVAGLATLAGSGAQAGTGTATLAAQPALIAATGTAQHLATGTLPAGVATLVSTGTARWTGTGTLPAGVATLAGAGLSGSQATLAALQASTAFVTGAEGVVVITGTGSLPAQSSQLSGTGLSRSIGTGALSDATAAVAGAGLSRSVGVAPLVAQASVISAAGQAYTSGTGALAAGSATLTGPGSAIWVATGALSASNFALIGTGLGRWTGTGTLAAGISATSGAGLSESIGIAPLAAGRATVFGAEGTVIITGSGTLQAQSRIMFAVGGVSRSVGSGALVSDDAQVDAAGSVAVIGTGALAPSGALLSGSGVSRSTGTATLAAGVSQVAGTVITGWAGTGVLTAQIADLDGVAVSSSRGTGVLTVGQAYLVGVGDAVNTGTGTLVAGPAAISGTIKLSTSGFGVLVAQDRLLFGAGQSRSFGSGVLTSGRSTVDAVAVSGSSGFSFIQARPSRVIGFAELVAYGDGDLEAAPAKIAGNDLVYGSGVLVASAFHIVGIGTGQDAPTPVPTPLPGGYPGTASWGYPVATWTNPGTARPALPPPPWWLGRVA